MKDRIAKILRDERMTAAKFAEEIGVQASGISHILSGRNNPSTDFIIKILERFRGINSDWLLLGKGNMYKSGTNSSFNDAGQSLSSNLSSDLFSAAQTKLKDDTIQEEDINQAASEMETEIDSNTFATEKPLNINKPSSTNIEYDKSKRDRKVEKIVIFFNDNSFESYNPHQK